MNNIKKLVVGFVLLFSAQNIMSQQEKNLPFREIPEYPEEYTSNLLVARMIDGLGFRYYWATEGLKNTDLAYKASESGRTSLETINHIYGLSKFLRNSVLENDKDANKEELSFLELRSKTLINFKKVSDALKNASETFKFEDTSVPFWNIINGPIADALWHCGQIVMLRRASGNPFNSKVSVFSGKLKH